MQNKLQELTDKLYQEGLSKGKQEGENLVAQAKAEADRIIKEAQAEGIGSKHDRHQAGHRTNDCHTSRFWRY